MIPHNQPLITNEDRAAVDAVLRSGWLAQGSQVEALERSFVSRHRGGEACAVSSGTSALFLALKGLGIGAVDIFGNQASLTDSLIQNIATK